MWKHYYPCPILVALTVHISENRYIYLPLIRKSATSVYTVYHTFCLSIRFEHCLFSNVIIIKVNVAVYKELFLELASGHVIIVTHVR